MRAARSAHQRWIAIQRVWAAMDRIPITDPDSQIRFVCRAMWPSLTATQVEALVARARVNPSMDAWQLRRPDRAEDVLGGSAARLMREYEP